MMDYDADLRLAARVARWKRHGRWVLVGCVLSGLAGLVFSLFLPKFYRATTYILVSDSKIGASSAPSGWQYTLMPTFIPFVDNDALIEQAIHRFHLDQPPYNLTVERFRGRDYLDVRVVKSTRLLELNLEFPEAHLAADLANSLAQGAAEFNDRLNSADTLATQKFLKQQLDRALEHLAQVERVRLEVRERARIEDREKELSILLSEKERTSGEMQQLRLSLAQNESRAQSLGKALESQPRTFRLTKSVTSDRFVERALEKANPQGGSPLSVTEEALNANHEGIQRDYVNSTASSAAEAAAIKEATARLQQTDAQLDGLLREVTLFRSEIEKADHDYTLAREAVDSATRDYRNASVVVSSKSQDLKQLSPALVPERPVRPRILLNTILASLLGLGVFMGLAVARESYREMRQPAPHYLEEESRRAG